MSTTVTPIAIGQRFRQDDGEAREQIVTIARLDHDAHGLTQVVFQLPDGREICAYEMQVEAALTDGSLVAAPDLPRFPRAGLDRLAS